MLQIRYLWHRMHLRFILHFILQTTRTVLHIANAKYLAQNS